MPGPRPTPNAKKEQRGSWRANLNKDYADFELGEPDMPEFLTGYAAEEWPRVIRQMKNCPGLLAFVDYNTVAQYCLQYQKNREAYEYLQSYTDENGMKQEPVYVVSKPDRILKDGTRIVGDVISIKPLPQVKMFQDSAKMMLTYARELGITPSARGTIRTNPNAEPKKKETGKNNSNIVRKNVDYFNRK